MARTIHSSIGRAEKRNSMTPGWKQTGALWTTALLLLGWSPRQAAGQNAAADSARNLMSAAATAADAGTAEAYREALRLRMAALAIRRRVGDQQGEGESLSWVALTWFQLGEPDSATRLARQAFGIRLSAGDTAGAVRTLSGVLAPAF